MRSEEEEGRGRGKRGKGRAETNKKLNTEKRKEDRTHLFPGNVASNSL
jgi:hypothetical protein